MDTEDGEGTNVFYNTVDYFNISCEVSTLLSGLFKVIIPYYCQRIYDTDENETWNQLWYDINRTDIGDTTGISVTIVSSLKKNPVLLNLCV